MVEAGWDPPELPWGRGWEANSKFPKVSLHVLKKCCFAYRRLEVFIPLLGTTQRRATTSQGDQSQRCGGR